MMTLAFTTRIPLAVMIAMGIKQWENRNAMPTPANGQCAMTCSKSSDEREYANFLAWAKQCFPAEAYNALPAWQQVSDWRGKLIAICDYCASNTPGDAVLDEGYPVWWHLTNVRLLSEPLPCRGSVGMWRLSSDLIENLQRRIISMTTNKDIYAFARKWLEIFKADNFSLVEEKLGEDCASLGFSMDCGNEISARYPGIMHDREILSKKIKTLTDINLLGGGIYSQWRYYQHWACSPWDKEWFLIALQRIQELSNE